MANEKTPEEIAAEAEKAKADAAKKPKGLVLKITAICPNKNYVKATELEHGPGKDVYEVVVSDNTVLKVGQELSGFDGAHGGRLKWLGK